MAKRGARSFDTLADLVPHLLTAEGFPEVIQSLESGNSAAIDGAWGSACALCAAAMASIASKPLLVVVPKIRDTGNVADDMSQFGTEDCQVFPAWETLPDEHAVTDTVFGGRLRILNALDAFAENTTTTPPVVLASMPALMQPVPSRAAREAGTRAIAVGDEVDLEEFMAWLVERGFERVTAIELPGEFTLHGGILDVFPPSELNPFRIEFFGDEVESIRRFDVESQRKLSDLKRATLTVISPTETTDDEDSDATSSLLDSFPPGSWVVLMHLPEIVEEGKQYLDRLSDRRGLFSVNAALAKCTDFPSVTVTAIGADSLETSCHLHMESIERFSGDRETVLMELAEIAGRDEERVLVACHNEAERSRLSELFHESAENDPDLQKVLERMRLCHGQLTSGFRFVSHKLIVVGDHELFGRTDVRKRTGKRKKHDSRAIDSFLDLNEGDLVVHLANGIGRYRGMKLLEKDDTSEEHLEIEFRDNVRVFVPVSLIHLVQKYVGAAKSVPQLSKLGTTSWAKKKARVAEAISDMASDMLKLQAQRESKPGLSSAADSKWQTEFEDAFPYTETEDQLNAIHDFKDDMELQRPMDRLICGDVGYGKTEVAMRAAFKCIDNGRQVAMLVPTTVLAEQHYRTFCQRMAEYPIEIEVLSRFRTKAQQRDILERMESGGVDLVVGTHRIVQKDIRFKNLGLLIIDEEQRFGVQAKEMLKLLKLEIDVLTLSATPIPRTLHMSLLGIRDISSLTTAPQERQPVETRVGRFDTVLIRNAIVRELNRGGQVFFVHNRVYNIQSIADRIRTIVPECTVGVVHGQMKESELEPAMVDFVSGRTDVLVATTIIESGLDIPNANTIFINEADIYGLADLHQLRGRVGRYNVRAYCYLMLAEGKTVTNIAAKRLKAIEEYSELGAGFKIAMRDLEIRGAGNILGTQQSGHISAVGYELYCQLLENAVRRLKKEAPREQPHVAVDLPISAYFPNAYIPPGRVKIEIYRRLSQLANMKQLEEFAEELRDRFGPIPKQAYLLLRIKELQIHARRWTINDIHMEDGYVYFGYRNPSGIQELAALAGHKRLRIADRNSAYLVLKTSEFSTNKFLKELYSVLSLGSDEPALGAQ